MLPSQTHCTHACSPGWAVVALGLATPRRSAPARPASGFRADNRLYPSNHVYIRPRRWEGTSHYATLLASFTFRGPSSPMPRARRAARPPIDAVEREGSARDPLQFVAMRGPQHEWTWTWAPGLPCSPVPIPGPFLPVWFYSFLEIHKHFYSLSKPDDALGGRYASLVCNLSHAYHFYDCAPPPRLPSYAGPPCAAGTTHDSFSQMCTYGRWHIACAAYGLGLLLVPLVSYSTYALTAPHTAHALSLIHI